VVEFSYPIANRKLAIANLYRFAPYNGGYPTTTTALSTSATI
jgi:hypothetical protein